MAQISFFSAFTILQLIFHMRILFTVTVQISQPLIWIWVQFPALMYLNLDNLHDLCKFYIPNLQMIKQIFGGGDGLVTTSCPTLMNHDPMNCSPTGLCLWDFPGRNTRLGCYFLLQRIFPTQKLNSHLLHCRQILYH